MDLPENRGFARSVRPGPEQGKPFASADNRPPNRLTTEWMEPFDTLTKRKEKTMKLNYTLDPYRRLYLPEDVAALKAALKGLRGDAPKSFSENSTYSSERTTPISKDRFPETWDLGCGLLGCIVKMYECMATTFQVALAMELSSSNRDSAPKRSEHPEIVRSLGKDIEAEVKQAVVDNAYMLTHYEGFHVSQSGRPSNVPLSVDAVQYRDSSGDQHLNRKVLFEYLFPASPEMIKSYTLPALAEPFAAFLDPPSPDGTGNTELTLPGVLRPRPYEESMRIIRRESRESLRFARELQTRIADIFCNAVRIEMGYAGATTQEQDVSELYTTIGDLGEACGILYRQILAATANVKQFVTLKQAMPLITARNPSLGQQPLVQPLVMRDVSAPSDEQ